jgi:NCS2 family nucleobase:cation symporter-2
MTEAHEVRIFYKIEDRPPLFTSVVLGLQHVFAAFGGIVAVPLIVGGALGLPMEDRAFLVSCALFMAGVTTFIQAFGLGPVGARLPCVMGTDFTFVGPSIAVGKSMGLAAVFGATLLGGFLEVILSRFVPFLRRLFPPIVTGTVVALIGLTLIPVSVDWAAGGLGAEDYGSLSNLAVAILVACVVLLLNRLKNRFISPAAVLIGIGFGYVISLPLGLLDFSPVREAKFVAMPMPMRWGFRFSLAALIPFLIAYLVTTIETVGDLLAIGVASGEKPDNRKLAAGILADGVGSMLAPLFNATANTSFSQNVGIIPLTGVASRYVVMIAAVILVILGIFPKVGALVAVMPNPVLGGAAFIMFGMVAAAGIKMIARAQLGTRNLVILAVSLGLGLGVTMRPAVLSGLPENLKILFQSGIVTGTIAALLLNLVLPSGD